MRTAIIVGTLLVTVSGAPAQDNGCTERCDETLADDFLVLFGTHQGGGAADLHASDDTYVSIQQRAALTPLLPVIRMEAWGTLPAGGAGGLTVIFEANATAQPPNVPQRLEQFSDLTGLWVVIDERTATIADTVVEVVLDDPAQYISPADRVHTRMSCFNPGNVFSPAWGANIDQLGWESVPCLFDYGPVYPDAEAWQIGLEMLGAGGAITLDQATYDRIDRDLDLIRIFEPNLAGQGHTPAWVADELIVKLIPGAPRTAWRCSGMFYDVIDIRPLFGTWVVVTFASSANIPALGQVYMALPNTEFAEPNGLIGGENFWTPTDLGGGVWRWSIDDGFLDCFDGCDCHRLYEIEVDGAGNVMLISYDEVGQSWCEF